MPTLSAMDLAMFMLESPERPFNIGPLVLLRPSKAAAPAAFADKLRDKLLKRPPGPPFNVQLKMSLLKAPAVEPMARPELKRHVHRLTLDGASMPQLLETVCELHEPLLDRSGLLWQFWIIDGLADGRVALYGKVHHGIIDGRTFVKAVTQWLSTDAKDRSVRAMWDGVERSSGSGRQRAGHRRAGRQGRGWRRARFALEAVSMTSATQHTPERAPESAPENTGTTGSPPGRSGSP